MDAVFSDYPKHHPALRGRKRKISDYYRASKSKVHNFGQKTYTLRRYPFRDKNLRTLKNVFLPQSTYSDSPRMVRGYGSKRFPINLASAAGRKKFKRRSKYFKKPAKKSNRYGRRKGSGKLGLTLAKLTRQIAFIKNNMASPWQVNAGSANGVTSQTTVNKAYYTFISTGIRASYGALFAEYREVGKKWDAGTDIVETYDMSNKEGCKLQTAGITLKRIYRNNYNLPVFINYWYLTTKEDTSSSPTVLMATGMTSNGIADTDSPLFYPGTSKIFKKYYGMSKMKTIKLDPGQQHTFVCKSRGRIFNSSNYIDNTNAYCKGSKFIFFRLMGCVGNDASTNTGFSLWKLDWVNLLKTKYRFLTSASTVDYTETDSLGTPTAIKLEREPAPEGAV